MTYIGLAMMTKNDLVIMLRHHAAALAVRWRVARTATRRCPLSSCSTSPRLVPCLPHLRGTRSIRLIADRKQALVIRSRGGLGRGRGSGRGRSLF